MVTGVGNGVVALLFMLLTELPGADASSRVTSEDSTNIT